MAKKNILFVTATRAEFGKIKNMIAMLNKNKKYNITIIVTGMHMMSKYGSTYLEVKNFFPKNKIIYFKNQTENQTQDIALSTTIKKISPVLKKISPDLIIIHGDRVEALAVAISGSFNNYLIAHLEGGEVSGTIDEHIRHSVSKLSHLHFVSNKFARKRLLQLGEHKKNIFITGSPETDIMRLKNLPSLRSAKGRYGITFKNYCILLYHPVTTEKKTNIQSDLNCLLKVIKFSKKNFLVIYPNNDPGSKIITFNYNQKFKKLKNVKIFRSIRFEYYLTLLKNSYCIIGNSSSGVREAPFYGVPSLDLGNRQKNRTQNKSIFNLNFNYNKILKTLDALNKKNFAIAKLYGEGDSAKKIVKILNSKNIWLTPRQKYLQEI